MMSLSSQRPIFLRRSQRLVIKAKQLAVLFSIVALSAYAAGYFFGGA